MSPRIKIVIGALVFFLLIGAVYVFLIGNTNEAAVTSSGSPASEAEVLFLNLSNQLDPISFNTSVFQDSRFTSLVDIHTAILPEALGRKDPFGPIGGE
jgi:hypothetical protein